MNNINICDIYINKTDMYNSQDSNDGQENIKTRKYKNDSESDDVEYKNKNSIHKYNPYKSDKSEYKSITKNKEYELNNSFSDDSGFIDNIKYEEICIDLNSKEFIERVYDKCQKSEIGTYFWIRPDGDNFHKAKLNNKQMHAFINANAYLYIKQYFSRFCIRLYNDEELYSKTRKKVIWVMIDITTLFTTNKTINDKINIKARQFQQIIGMSGFKITSEDLYNVNQAIYEFEKDMALKSYLNNFPIHYIYDLMKLAGFDFTKVQYLLDM